MEKVEETAPAAAARAEEREAAPEIAKTPIEPDPLRREEQDWQEHVRRLLKEQHAEELRTFLDDIYASDIADLLEHLDFEQGHQIFQLLSPDEQGEVLRELDDTLRDHYLEDVIPPSDVAQILVEQPSDQAADLLEELNLERVSEILSHVPHQDRVKVTELLSYPENTAGAIMTKEFVSVQESDTVKKAISSIRKMSKPSDEIHNVYVVDKDGRYKGHMRIAKLILAKPQTKVKRIIEEELLPIPVLTDQEEVARFFTRYDFFTAPVVDDRGVLVGRITVDDVLEVVEAEATEDIQRMGGVSGEETLGSPLLRSSLQRMLWLAVNLTTAFLSAAVIGLFETTIEKKVILSALMPIVAGMGGNAGSQSMALVIRNIALGELTPTNTRRALYRESLIGLMNGLMIGLLTGAAVFLFTAELMLGGVIFLALLFNLTVAATAGTLIPIFLRRTGIDPAIASSILVTTCTDVGGFFAFLGCAYLALSFGMG